MTFAVYVPCDAGALSLGAGEVAHAIAREATVRGLELQLVRNGSRGAFWLEPLVEVATARGRMAYGPVSVGDVPGLFDAEFLGGGTHPLSLGLTDAIPWLASQQRLTFARVGIVDPASVADYVIHGGYQGLRRALALSPEAVVETILGSGLRGRGGAAFPTGIKWKTVLEQPAGQKYVTCNADEGDSGTFSDRMLMEGDPLSLIEGMTIAGLAVGATQGYIYLRAEYPARAPRVERAIAAAYQARYLGADVMGSGKRFDLEVRLGAGAYICGEETSMLESLEGRRGEVRVRPPLPAIKGLFGRPTIVNNVITLATVPTILHRGAEFYAGYGMGKSRGTLPLQLAGNIKRGGLVERAFGLTLRELLYDYGGGSASRPAAAGGSGRRPARRLYTRPRSSTRSWTTRRSAASARCSATAASSLSTTPSTWRGWRATRWSSARSSPAASARPAVSARRGAWRSSTTSSRAGTRRATCAGSRSCASSWSGIALRPGRHGAVPGAERAAAFQEDFAFGVTMFAI